MSSSGCGAHSFICSFLVVRSLTPASARLIPFKRRARLASSILAWCCDSTMLSFMNRTTRRKAKKIDIASIKHIQSPPSSERFTSPAVVDIKAPLLSPHSTNIGENRKQGDSLGQAELVSPTVQLDLPSDALSTFFPSELLGDIPSRPVRAREGGKATPVRNDSRRALDATTRNVTSEVGQNGRPRVFSAETDSSDDQIMNTGRRMPPARIQIPPVDDTQTQIDRSTSDGPVKSHPYASSSRPLARAQTRPDSIVEIDAELDNMSTISGTTLAQALISSAFPLHGPESRRTSHYRSGGISRQDSATLPKGEYPLVNSPYWKDRRTSARGEIVHTPGSHANSDIPPVPPMPTSALLLDIPPEMHSRPSSGVSQGESEFQSKASSTLLPPETPPLTRRRGSALLHLNEPLNVRPISRISEASSPVPSTCSQPPLSAGTSPCKSAEGSHSSPSPSHSRDQQDSTPPSSAPPSSARPPASTSYSERSGKEIDQVLDDYRFLSPMDRRFPGHQSPSSSKLLVPSAARSRSNSQNGDSSLTGRVIYSVKSEPEIVRANSRGSTVSKDRRLQNSVIRLPIGTRRGSGSVPESPFPEDDEHTANSARVQHRLSRTTRRLVHPPSASLAAPADDPPQSPDLLDDILLPVTHSIFHHQRSGSIPSPIRVIREPTYSLGIPIDEGDQTNESNSPSTGSHGHQQTFPETPRLFTPMWTPDLTSAPPVPAVPPSPLPPVMRRVSANVVSSSSQAPRGEQSSTNRASSATVPDARYRSRAATIPPPMSGSRPVSPNGQIITVIDSDPDVNSTAIRTPLHPSPNPPSPQPSSVPSEFVPSNSPPAAMQQTDRPSSPALGNCILEKSVPSRSNSLDAPPPRLSLRAGITLAAPESPMSPGNRSPPGPLSRPPRTPPEEPFLAILTPSFVPPPSYQAAVNDTPVRESSAPEYNSSQMPQNNPPAGARRSIRPRPPLPIGPRRPSQPAVYPPQSLGLTGRERNGSVSSLTSNAMHHSPYTPGTALSSPPRFQTVPVRFRGYTIDMAKWTFTSEELQAVVSKAIVHSSQASSIRILSLDVLDHAIPEEMRRLEDLSGELKTRYKLLARKRTALLGALSRSPNDAAGAMEYSPRLRALEDLAETCASLDQVVEELHVVNDQIHQLQRLTDMHSSSALAMALRKLNTSWIKKAAEAESLKARVATLEAERDEAWKQAEDVAHEYDDLQDRMNENAGAQTPSSAMSGSRRSSRVLVARKTSLRASKAGLRTTSARRSQRLSSSSSQRVSPMPLLSAARSTFSSDEVPPVPPIPPRRPGIVTSDLASRSSMVVSSGVITALSAERAIVEAELCDMLGIKVGD
ncbi:hypothetical protein OE88DRAFT_1697578, partial [Heliocybe sulcata]